MLVLLLIIVKYKQYRFSNVFSNVLEEIYVSSIVHE